MYMGLDDHIHCEGTTKFNSLPITLDSASVVEIDFWAKREFDTKHIELEMMENKMHFKKLCTC